MTILLAITHKKKKWREKKLPTIEVFVISSTYKEANPDRPTTRKFDNPDVQGLQTQEIPPLVRGSTLYKNIKKSCLKLTPGEPVPFSLSISTSKVKNLQKLGEHCGVHSKGLSNTHSNKSIASHGATTFLIVSLKCPCLISNL